MSISTVNPLNAEYSCLDDKGLEHKNTTVTNLVAYTVGGVSLFVCLFVVLLLHSAV